MRVDRPDEPDEPDERPDSQVGRRDDEPTSDSRASRPAGTPPETRYRQECYDDQRRKDSAEQTAAARQASADEQASWEKWQKDKEDSRQIWSEYQRKWPPTERPKADRPDAEEGSWQGEGGSFLSRANNERVEAACDKIAILEEEKITPAMREIESQDPDRRLVGLGDCRKGLDRIKEKVYDDIEEKNRSPEKAVSLIPDTLRYTFQYPEARYTQGVWAEITRLTNQGFEERTRKNFWTSDQYKGINSQWIHSESGQRLEVQFHTRISFAAKQFTHKAYEKLRSGQPNESQKMDLKDFQRKVSSGVPVPRGATDIPDYRERDADAR